MNHFHQVRRVVLGLQYDGTPWHGWQTQPHRKTVQDQLEKALQQFTQTRIETICAGRTDTGVHALEQIIHFDTNLQRENFSWVRGLNALLPSSIAVRWCTEVPAESVDGFHARFSAHARTYQYVIYNHAIRSPVLHNKTGWVFRSLDVDKMTQASQYLIGEHDFSAFRSSACQAKTPHKILYQLHIKQHHPLIVLTFRANAFLHHMVRNMVGALVWIAMGNRSPEWIKELLDSRDRRLAAPTFAPEGLYLTRVEYHAKWKLVQEEVPLTTLSQIFC